MIPLQQKTPYHNPWPLWTHVVLCIWQITWLICCSWTPKFFNPWRLIILRIFGSEITGIPFVHSSAKIKIPWHLTLRHRACLGEKSNSYNLGKIEVHERATISQEVYLCTGTHDFKKKSMQLITQCIIVRENAFVGVRAMILPGVTIGKNAIVGAQSVITKDLANDEIFAGNPASKIGMRETSK